ncbi:histidine phosphatase family protein [Sphingopyxis sp.]|uniref:histidine phosphatase family protein n=1 Tax=Sphingopyxis sp. TaxID=1908224 RepID=UPI0035AF506B
MTGFALHLLRHGAPVQPGLFMGRTDGVPTTEGIDACARQAAGVGVRRLIASDKQRCARAAKAIGEAQGLTPTLDARWRELDFGSWEGQAASAIEPEALGRFWADPDLHPPPGGERWGSLAARVSDAIDALAPMDTLVVTHGGAMRAALHHLCGFDPHQLWAFDLPYGALLSLRIWRGDRPGAQIIGLRI